MINYQNILAFIITFYFYSWLNSITMLFIISLIFCRVIGSLRVRYSSHWALDHDKLIILKTGSYALPRNLYSPGGVTRMCQSKISRSQTVKRPEDTQGIPQGMATFYSD